MMKATHDQISRFTSEPYQLDATDTALLAARIEQWNSHQGPRVGDYVITSKGLLRFTYDWDDTIQTTSRGFGGSFYISESGYMDYSGGLDSGVPKTALELTEETRDGACWFFSHDYRTAHNGVDVVVPCRVYRLVE